MPGTKLTSQEVKNRLLEKLEKADYERLRPHLESVSLAQGDVLCRGRERIKHVYFPTSAMLSRIVYSEEGERVEVSSTGWEGMVGTPPMLGRETSPYQLEVEMAGDALRMDVERFMEEFQRSPLMRRVLYSYVQVMIVHLMQSAACNAFHTVEQRLCRWLLLAHDRVKSNDLTLTHEVLAGMIASNRAGVTVVVGTLQDAGLLEVHRGRITIVDREGLEAASCECYRIIRDETDKFLNG